MFLIVFVACFAALYVFGGIVMFIAVVITEREKKTATLFDIFMWSMGCALLNPVVYAYLLKEYVDERDIQQEFRMRQMIDGT